MRKIITAHEFPPIPIRSFDWCAYFDGDEELGNYGRGRTEAAAVADLVENYGDDADWIEWNGGACPVPAGTPVEIMLRASPDDIDPSRHPERLRWSHFETTLGSGDIIAFRLVEGA
jgi:hypothetical protein